MLGDWNALHLHCPFMSSNKAVFRSGCKWALICTWNEWHEGSEIEPSLEYGYQYINLTTHHTSKFKSYEG